MKSEVAAGPRVLLFLPRLNMGATERQFIPLATAPQERRLDPTPVRSGPREPLKQSSLRSSGAAVCFPLATRS
ncbi:MAG: hypothetical protein ACI87O_002858 [Planctomycetota bacterium]|jgi:hypothetical protein